MQECPFCLKHVRQVGGVALMTPAMIAESSDKSPLIGACCVDCMGLLAIVFDGLRGGKINALADKFIQSGAIRRN